jgi:DNA-binding NtrC family response regulator
MAKYLIIEDDSLACLNLSAMLAPHGEVETAYDSVSGKKMISKGHYDLVFIDLDLEKELIGLDLISLSAQKSFYTIILSGREEEENVTRAYKLGCQDYLQKPFSHKELSQILEKFQLQNKKEIMQCLWNECFITQEKSLIRAWEMSVPQILISDRPVLITGETGTGKTILAKFIHRYSPKAHGPLIHLNCAEIPETLLESELFGHEKGAFSGAVATQKGKLEMANGGELFLDEIGTMSTVLQKKLLKALEEKSFYRLGSNCLIRSDFRLISATCDLIDQMVKSGHFRQDLYFRIDGHRLHLTPLRERPEDISFLVKYFLRLGQRRIVITNDALDMLKNYNWPGNVRELQKIIDLLKMSPKGIISVEDLPAHILAYKKDEKEDHNLLNHSHIDYVAGHGLPKFVKAIEKQAIKHFYQENREKVRPTLRQLKISNNLFYQNVKAPKNPV